MTIPSIRHGQGPHRLILLHPYPVNKGYFQRMKKYLPVGWRVVIPDMVSFGEHQINNSEALTMEHLATEIVTEFGGNDGITILGGVSMGGYVTLAAAELFPNFAEGYILANTKDTADADAGASRRKTVEQIEDGGRDVYIENLLPKLIGKSNLNDTNLVNEVKQMINTNGDETLCQALLGMAIRPDRSSIAQEIEKPILLLTGNEDLITGPTVMKDMDARYLNSQYIEIESAGHYAMLERPASCSQHVYEFLAHLG